jgi:hypothetical protein
MSGSSTNRVDSHLHLKGETDDLPRPHQDLFFELTQLQALQRAYAQLYLSRETDSSGTRSEPSFAGEELNGFLQQLSNDLRAGTFRVTSISPQSAANKISDSEARGDLRNRIVQSALAHALESVFQTDSPPNAISWTASVISQGLSRVYAVTVEESEADFSEHILAAVRQRVDDSTFLTLLGDVLQGIDVWDAAGVKPLALALTRIAFRELDLVLHQANLLGRQASQIHGACRRFDREVALFLDHDAQYDWMLPAVQKRLREALAKINAQVDPEKTQLVDLARGEKLRFLDHEFRLSKERDGTACVEYKRLEKTEAPKTKAQKPSRRTWKLPRPAWPRGARPKPAAPDKAPAARRRHWPSLSLHWPRWSWNWSLNVPRSVYVVASGLIIVAVLVAGTIFVVALFRNQGPQLYPVRGQVFYEGKPAAGALVVFLPQDPRTPQTHTASALVEPDGSYVLGTQKARDGALAGPYLVTIWSRRGTATQLPPRYANRRSTPLKAIVAMGPTDVPVIELQAQPP